MHVRTYVCVCMCVCSMYVSMYVFRPNVKFGAILNSKKARYYFDFEIWRQMYGVYGG